MVSSLPLFLIIYDKNKMKLSMFKSLRRGREGPQLFTKVK